jgi:hypothetical protein
MPVGMSSACPGSSVIDAPMRAQIRAGGPLVA